MRSVQSKRHPKSSRCEELPRVCGAGVAGAFGAFEQTEALEVVEVIEEESFVWVIGQNQ